MAEQNNKNHRLVDQLEIHVDTDGLEHEIPYDRLCEILDGYDILLGTLADNRTYNPDDVRVQQKESAEMKLSHKLYLSPAKEGCYAATLLLYDDSEEYIQQLPFNGTGFEPVLTVINCTANGNIEQFNKIVPSKLARKRVLEGVRKVSPAEGERVMVITGIEERKTIELKKAKVIPFEKMQPVEEEYTDAEVIGRIVVVDFEKHRLSLRPNGATKRFAIDYDPDMEDRLMAKRQDSMCVKCKVKYNINGDIEDIKDADGIEALDLQDILISEFEADGVTHVFKEAIVVRVGLDETGQVYIGTYDPLGLVVYAEYRDELLGEVKADLSWRWTELVQEEVANLAPDATAVRATFLDLVVE